MLNQILRNLRSQHLLILITLIIFAIIINTLHGHFQENFIHFSSPSPTLSASNHSSSSHLLNLSKQTNIKKEIVSSNHAPPLSKTSSSPTMTVATTKTPIAIWQTITLKQGDSLSRLFSNLSISYNDLDQITKLPDVKKYLTKMRIGQQLEFQFNHKRQLTQIKYAFNDIDTLLIARKHNHFTSEIHSKPLDTKILFKEFTVHGSVLASMGQAGLTSELYSELQQIFHSSINFATNVRPGDRFNIMYQEYYVNGHKYKPGNILLANFVSSKEHITGIRYTDPTGKSAYYTPEGQGMQAMFLASPLHYKYISSYFTLHRFDPYLHRYRPHLGVDYAAPKGTPIHSVGDGVIAYRGWYTGFGNTIIIKYSNMYKALYGHMTGFASNLKTGEHVNKGQVIGYVGSTGWATGDHLHFGWYVNNIPKDPLKYTADATTPIPYQYRHSFLAQTKTLFNQFELFKSTQFAENKNDHVHDE